MSSYRIPIPSHTSHSSAGGTAFSIANFSFQPGKTPLSSFTTAFLTCVVYLLVVWLLKQWINEKRKAFDLKKVVVVYNFTMSFLSGVLFLVLVRELLHVSETRTFRELFVNEYRRNNYGLLTFCYYINYIFKYIELVDTVFLCLRFKQTPFIHVYHHAITLMLCWTQLTVGTCMQWVLISINLFVHIWLYAYYALYELKVEMWWKRYLTTVQIVQFMIALVASLVALFARAAYDFFPEPFDTMLGLPCTGSWPGSFFGLAVIISYLYLFTKLYNEKYQPKGEPNKQKQQTMTKSATSTTSRQPEFSSTFSPACKPSSIASSSTSASSILSSIPALAAAEDAFEPLRTKWVNHPFAVAERRRWAEHVTKVGAMGAVSSAIPSSEAKQPAAATATSSHTDEKQESKDGKPYKRQPHASASVGLM